MTATMTTADLLDVGDWYPSRSAPTVVDPLFKSIQAVGILEPLMVKRSGNRFVVVDGAARLAVARKLGLYEIPVTIIEPDAGPEAQTAHVIVNSVRRALTRTEQFKAIELARGENGSFAATAASLGLTEQRARQLSLLARLHPDVMRAVEDAEADRDNDPPTDRDLAVISAASHEDQLAALKAETFGDWVRWADIVNHLTPRRISQHVAIFDTDTADIIWDTDLFAEPGSPDHVTTRNIAGFIDLQRQALAALFASRKPRNAWKLAEFNPSGEMPVLPNGMRLVSTGDVDIKPRPGQTAVGTVCAGGRRIGQILVAIAEPIAKPAAKSQPADADDDDDEQDDDAPDDDDDSEAAEDAAPPQPAADITGITKAGRDLVAAAKSETLKEALRTRAEPHSWRFYCVYLLLALHANNVNVSGTSAFHSPDALRHLVTPEGLLTLPDDADLAGLIGIALAEAINIDTPSQERASYQEGSGPVAEWLGAALAADDRLPRFDTAAVLATITGDALRHAATAAGITNLPTKVPDLRARLAGKFPTYRPPGATFGAPGPKPGPAPRGTIEQEDAA